MAMDLDDILGELSNLEEQLELQQEEFAKTTQPSGVKPKGGSIESSYSLSSDFLNSLNSGTKVGEFSDTLRRTINGGTSRNYSRSQDYLSRNPAELQISNAKDVEFGDRFESARLGVGDSIDGHINSVRFDIGDGLRQSGVRSDVNDRLGSLRYDVNNGVSQGNVKFDFNNGVPQSTVRNDSIRQGSVRFDSNDGNGNVVSRNGSSTLPRNSSLRLGSPEKRATLGSPEKRISGGIASSCSSSRNSAQSFGSDWNEGGMMMGGQLNYGSVINGQSTIQSTNSCSTLSSQSSGSSSTSGSPRKSLPVTCVKVFSPDGTSKTLGTDQQTTVAQLCLMLIKKNGVAPNPSWTVLEQVRDLYMERILEDHQKISEVLECWVKDSQNRLLFADVPQKYDMFVNQEIVFDNDTYTPNVEGHLYLKLEGKKQWRKMYFVLRASGIYYSLKGKGKQSPSDLTCLQTLRDVELFTAVNWRKVHKSPTDFGFALKTAMIQKPAPKYIKYLCADDVMTLWRWVTAIRLVKYGKRLLDNYHKARVSSTARITRSATTLGNSSSAVIGQTSQPSSSKPRSGSLAGDGFDQGYESNHARSELGGLQISGGGGISEIRREGMTMGRNGERKIGSLDELRDERTNGDVRQSFRGGVSDRWRAENRERTNSALEEQQDFYASATEKYGTNNINSDISQGCKISTKPNQMSERSYVDHSIKEERVRCSSTDRLLDDSANYGTARRSSSRARSGSVDRLLDGDSRMKIQQEEEEDDYEPDGWDDFDAGTIRRSSRYSSGTLGSRAGSLRRYSNAITPNKMVANIPITTNVTRQMSMQQDVRNDARTLPRTPKNSKQSNDDDINAYQSINKFRDGSSQRRSSQGSISGASRLNSILSKAAARPVSNTSDRGSLQWSSENSDSTCQLGAEKNIQKYISPDKMSHIYSDIPADAPLPLSQISQKLSSHGGVISSRVNFKSLDDIPPPPPPENTGGQNYNGAKYLSNTEHPFPTAPIPPPLSLQQPPSSNFPSPCQQQPNIPLSTSRQPPASPNVLPPPPPDFLLAFTPTQAWSRSNGDNSFEENLDQQLEYLEHQVNQLSPRDRGGDRTDANKIDRSFETAGNIRDDTSDRASHYESKASHLEARNNVSSELGVEISVGVDLASTGTVGSELVSRNKVESVYNSQQYACPTSVANGNSGHNNSNQEEHLYQSININQMSDSPDKTPAMGGISNDTTLYADRVGSNTDSGHFTDSSASVASSGYYKSRDVTDYGYASIEEALPSNLPHNFLPKPADIPQRTVPNAVSQHSSIPQKPAPPSRSVSQNHGEVTIPLKTASYPNSISRIHGEIPSPYVGSPPSSPPPIDISLKVSVTGSIRRQRPPAPPKRSESTKLSTRVDGNRPETTYFLRDLDRVISQKHEQGADGLGNLEMPLPPPPPLILEDDTLVNFVDLPPPPPADMLLGLRTLKRDHRPPRVPPKPR